MNEQELIPEDWNAAEEVLARIVPDEAERNELRIEFARRHAQVSDHLFRLLYELRPPRNCREVWYLQLMSHEIDDQEFARLHTEHARRPLDLEVVDSFYQELNERLGWLIKFWQAIFTRSDDYELGRRLTVSAAQRDRYLREVSGLGSLSGNQIESLVTLVEQVRVERNLGLAEWGDYSESCAHRLLAKVRDVTRDRWKYIREYVVHQLLTNKEVAFHRFEVYMKREWTAPPFFILSGILRQEAAAVRLALRGTSPRLESQYHAVALGRQEKVTQSKALSAPAFKKHDPSESINFNNWALGLEDGQHWYLFHRMQNRWDQRPKVKIADGHQIRLLTAFVEGGGSLLIANAIDLQRPHYRGARDAQILKLIKHTISDLRECIRGIIAGASNCVVDSSMNPIRLKGDRWIAEIEIGIATWDEGKLCFELVKKRG